MSLVSLDYWYERGHVSGDNKAFLSPGTEACQSFTSSWNQWLPARDTCNLSCSSVLYRINTDFPGCWWLISIRVSCICARTSVNEWRLGTVSNIVPHAHSFWVRISYWSRTSRQGYYLSREAQRSVCLCLFQAGLTRICLLIELFFLFWEGLNWGSHACKIKRNLLGMCVRACVRACVRV